MMNTILHACTFQSQGWGFGGHENICSETFIQILSNAPANLGNKKTITDSPFMLCSLCLLSSSKFSPLPFTQIRPAQFSSVQIHRYHSVIIKACTVFIFSVSLIRPVHLSSKYHRTVFCLPVLEIAIQSQSLYNKQHYILEQSISTMFFGTSANW